MGDLGRDPLVASAKAIMSFLAYGLQKAETEIRNGSYIQVVDS